MSVAQPSEFLAYMTVRLQCAVSPTEIRTGTGFFFELSQDDGSSLVLLVTNKHVSTGAVTTQLAFAVSDSEGHAVPGPGHLHQINHFQHTWINHPDGKTDLAVLPLIPIVQGLRSKGVSPFISVLTEQELLTDGQAAELSAVQDIVMVGYPNGVWDKANNMPIFRRGLTATSPKRDYNGLPEFVIDCACFPGSSGSPVVIFDEESFADSHIITFGRSRMLFLGVLYAGPQHSATGEIKVIETPLAQRPIVLSQIPNNLGFVIKARKLLEFRGLFRGNQGYRQS